MTKPFTDFVSPEKRLKKHKNVKVHQEWTEDDHRDYLSDFFGINPDNPESMRRFWEDQAEKALAKGYDQHDAEMIATGAEALMEAFIKEHLTNN